MKQTVPDHNLSQFSNKKRWFSDLLRCHWFLVLLAWSISIFFYKIFYPENSVLDCGTKCSTYRIMKCVKRKSVKLPLLTRDHRLELKIWKNSKSQVAGENKILFTFLAMTRFVPKIKPFPQPKKNHETFLFSLWTLAYEFIDG